MNLYFLEDENVYVRNQAEAKGRGKSTLVDVPSTSKDEMITFLNDLRANLGRNCAVVSTASEAEAVLATGAGVASDYEEMAKVELPDYKPVKTDWSATGVLARMDNPGIDVDQIVETIGKSKGYALKRYAGAVAVAFQAMEKK